MKAKLIKTIDGYHLRSLIKDIPRSINVYHKISKNEGEFGFGEHSGKLSKQNCDEIFGAVDVEKLAEECAETAHTMDELYENGLFYGFISGFNKAIELNKDKVFTLEDMGNLWDFCTYNKGTFAEFIQQLTEIEVEIETERIPDGLDESCHIQYAKVPKLDSEGCLILTKK